MTPRTPLYPPYPPNTKAFLYYSMSPEKTRIAGKLRLRVISSDGPASFESGSDLLLTNSLPWMRPLILFHNILFDNAFIVEFSSIRSRLFIITEQGVESLKLNNAFSDGRNMSKRIRPYEGEHTNHHLSMLLY